MKDITFLSMIMMFFWGPLLGRSRRGLNLAQIFLIFLIFFWLYLLLSIFWIADW